MNVFPPTHFITYYSDGDTFDLNESDDLCESQSNGDDNTVEYIDDEADIDQVLEIIRLKFLVTINSPFFFRLLMIVLNSVRIIMTLIIFPMMGNLPITKF